MKTIIIAVLFATASFAQPAGAPPAGGSSAPAASAAKDKQIEAAKAVIDERVQKETERIDKDVAAKLAAIDAHNAGKTLTATESKAVELEKARIAETADNAKIRAAKQGGIDKGRIEYFNIGTTSYVPVGYSAPRPTVLAPAPAVATKPASTAAPASTTAPTTTLTIDARAARRQANLMAIMGGGEVVRFDPETGEEVKIKIASDDSLLNQFETVKKDLGNSASKSDVAALRREIDSVRADVSAANGRIDTLADATANGFSELSTTLGSHTEQRGNKLVHVKAVAPSAANAAANAAESTRRVIKP